MNISQLRLLNNQFIEDLGIDTKKNLSLKGKLKDLHNYIVYSDLSEDEVKALLYPKGIKGSKFRVLKNRYVARLLDEFLLSGVPKLSNYEAPNHKINALRKWTLIHTMLYNRKLSSLIIPVCEGLLKKCNRYDEIEIKLNVLRLLKYRYKIFDPKPKRILEIEKEFTETKNNYELLIIIEDIYISLLNLYLGKTPIHNNKLTELHTTLNRYRKQVDDSNIFQINFYWFNSYYFILSLRRNFRDSYEICNRAIKYFTTKKGFSKIALFQFYQKKGIALIALGNHKKANEVLNGCFKFSPKPGSLSWFYNYNYIFLNDILNQNYNNVYILINKTLNHKYLKSLNDTFREPWYLKEAFVHFLIRVGKIDTAAYPEVKLRAFRLSRFVNEVPTYSKDKKGLNITINIIQMLFLLLDRKYDRFLNKLQSLKQYNYRYLRDEKYIRPSSFIKMMGKIPVGRYRADIIRHKAEKYYKKLQENPFNFTEQALSLEIIPYEQLWEELLSIFPD